MRHVNSLISKDSIVGILPLAVILLGVISAWLKRPSIVGKRGERRVARALSTLDPIRFKILNDILIGTSKGSSQIDHIVFSRCGIFVIETKNLKGWIHGSEKDPTWTQTIYRAKQRILNPIHQNWSHIRALRDQLTFSGHLPIYPIVVFSGSGELKNVHVTSPVVYVNELTSLIECTGTKVLSDGEVEDLFGQVQQKNLAGKEARKRHISNVRTRVRNVSVRDEEGICPRCKGKLMHRKGRYGNFFGCSNYPRCRFTSNIGRGFGA
jgi:hypothetical protein